jgi:hypothetical protein
MSSTWDKVSSYLMTATSIFGTALTIPAVGGALTGVISWREAALPIAGGLIAILMNEKTAPSADGATVLKSVDGLANLVGRDMTGSSNVLVRDAGTIVPVVTDELEHAFANFQVAHARLVAAKNDAQAQAAKLNASLAKTVPAPLVVSVGPKDMAQTQQDWQNAKQSQLNTQDQQYTPAHIPTQT